MWDLNRADYAWPGPDHPEWNRTFELIELMPHLERNVITATVRVESADNDEDTDLIFDVAAQYAAVVGIVVYVPLDDPGRTAHRLELVRRDPRVVAVRNPIRHQADPDRVLRPDHGSLRLVSEAA